jgi:hypothetical protein
LCIPFIKKKISFFIGKTFFDKYIPTARFAFFAFILLEITLGLLSIIEIYSLVVRLEQYMLTKEYFDSLLVELAKREWSIDSSIQTSRYDKEMEESIRYILQSLKEPSFGALTEYSNFFIETLAMIGNPFRKS